MSWQEVDVLAGNAFASYKAKYGAFSNYQDDQELIYSDPEISKSFQAALSGFVIHPNQTVLDVGINNGFELRLIADKSPGLLESKVIGIDLAGDVLPLARVGGATPRNLTLLEGDVRKFKGRDIETNNEVEILDDSIDILVSLLTLQSTSLKTEFTVFLETLERKLKAKAEIFIGIPDFHITKQRSISLGLYDARTGQIDMARARDISEHISSFFKGCGFTARSIGQLIIFQRFSR